MVEVAVAAVAGGQPLWPDFRAAYQVNRVLDAIERWHAERRWVTLASDPV